MTDHPGGLASRSHNSSCVHLAECKMRDLPDVDIGTVGDSREDAAKHQNISRCQAHAEHPDQQRRGTRIITLSTVAYAVDPRKSLTGHIRV